MKILIISQYYQPDITAAANRISDTADLLQDYGHQVVVVTAMPHKSGSVDFKGYDETASPRIYRVGVSKGSLASTASYLNQFFGFTSAVFFRAYALARREEFDVVWVSSPPLPVVLASILLRALVRVPVVLDVRDIWPESAVNIGKIRSKSLLERLGLILENAAYRHAKRITCVSKPMSQYISKKTKVPVDVIYNGVSLIDFSSHTPVSVGSRTFCYAGNLGLAQDIPSLIQAFAHVLQHEEMCDSVLTLVGDGAVKQEAEDLVSSLGIQHRVTFYGAVPKAEALLIMQSADVLLIPLQDSPAFRLTVPSKVFDCMALCKPIVSNVAGEAKDILMQTDANLVATPGSIADLSQAMREAHLNWNELASHANKNYDVVSQFFSRDSMTRKLESVLAAALQNEKS